MSASQKEVRQSCQDAKCQVSNTPRTQPWKKFCDPDSSKFEHVIKDSPDARTAGKEKAELITYLKENKGRPVTKPPKGEQPYFLEEVEQQSVSAAAL
ncbi:uncharacterized protein E0L32_011593 [Thyridium curvatum]|uniref:Uncharacterized protein n=1 Tax=Thyridium curvatum TaxID=1093900 RepID=A0A507BNZ3_9PEZI|nr:uncharacterized protein E0L32_011593 [Thyridium curvatum]TPX18480.1 hypothetical protein E0L32_011593 [Thyridium curvatum]